MLISEQGSIQKVLAGINQEAESEAFMSTKNI